MALIKLTNFSGQAPISSPTRLPANMAQTAENCRFEAGVLKALRDSATVQASPDGTSTRTIFYYPPNSVWLTWDRVVDVQRSMIANDTLERLYWTDPTTGPQYATKTMIGSGAGAHPAASQRLGVLAPAAAPTLALVGSPTDPDDLADTRYYVFTYVESSGAEGPPSPVSTSVDVYPGQSVTVSGLGTTSPDPTYDLTYKRIYRTNTGSTGTVFQFVAQVALATDSYSDAVLSGNLGEELTTSDFDEPDDDLEGLVAHPGGFFAAYFGKTLCFSEPGYPYAWPVKYQLGVDYDIKGLGVVGSAIVVATTGNPYILDGGSPEVMSLRRIERNQACLSSRGVVDMGYAVCYPSPDGLVLATTGDVKVVTESLFSRTQWLALSPDSFVAVLWEDKYLCSYDTGTVQGSFMLDPANPGAGVVFYDTAFLAGHNYLINDYLYLQVGANIVTWDSGADGSYTWRSGKIRAPRPVNFGVLQVRADAYPVSFDLYADDARRHRGIVFDDVPVRLPAGYLGTYWELELTGSGEVYEVLLAETINDLRGA